MKGGLEERRPGVWLLKVSAGPDPLKPGRYLQRHEVFHGSKRDAQIRRAELLKQIRQGDTLDGRRMTVKDWCEHWLGTHVAAKGEKTAERYRQIVNLHIVPYLGSLPIRKLSEVQIEGLYARLRSDGRRVAKRSASGEEIRGLSARSIHHVHVVLGTLLNQAERKRVLERNPMVGVTSPNPNAVADTGGQGGAGDAKMKVMTKEQITKLVTGCRGDDLFELVALGAATGARLGELLALRWGDMDHQARTLRIERAVEDTTTKGARIKDPKTRSSARTIGVNADLVDVLRRRRVRQAEAALKVGLPPSGDALLFPKSPLEPEAPRRTRNVCKRFSAMAGRVGLGEFTFHCLRHSHGSHLLADGVPITAVSQRLGHASVATTARIYSHVLKRAEDRAVEAAGDLVKDALTEV